VLRPAQSKSPIRQSEVSGVPGLLAEGLQHLTSSKAVHRKDQSSKCIPCDSRERVYQMSFRNRAIIKSKEI